MNCISKFSVLSLSMCALGTTSVNAITLEDYIDPNSRYENAYINGSFRAANSAENASDQAEDDAAPIGDSANLNLNVNFERVNSSVQRVRKIQGNIGGSLAKDDSGTRDNIGANLSGSYDKYLKQGSPLFWFGGAAIDYLPNSVEELAANATLGLGYGRVINATPLAKALRLAEEFQKFALLQVYPNDQTMLEVAQIINREQEYRSRLGEEEYRTGWYQDIESVFESAGILADEGLGALGVIKIDQILNEESVSTRKHGWVARAGATAIIQDHNGNNGEPAASLGFEYAKPYGYKGQLINQTTYLLGDNSSLSNKLSYTYEVSDIVDWENTWDLNIQQPEEGEDVTEHRLTSLFAYEISNVLTLNTGVRVTDRDNTDTAAEFTTSLQYRLK